MAICTTRGVWPVLCAVVCALAVTPAAAQSAPQADAGADYASASPPANPMDAAKDAPAPEQASKEAPDDAPMDADLAPADAAETPAADADAAAAIGDDFTFGDALMFDPTHLAGTTPVKPLRLPGLGNPKRFDVNRADRPDGSSTVKVTDSLPTEWDAKIGADIGLAATPMTSFQPLQPLPGSLNDSGSGAAWASVGVTNLASVDARVDPTNDQSRLGTTLKHAMPIGGKFSVTLQDTVSVTQSLGAPATTTPQALAMAAPPAPTAAPSQVWGNTPQVKFDILPTGTSLSAGVASTSTDPVTHNTLSADQKLLGPLHVTTAVTDVGEPTVNKSITAGFKLSW
jgi:hypothetical protein